MLTTDEQRAEARRLVELDEHGRLIEAVALALRIGDDQEAAMSDLARMDREFVEEFADGGLGAGSVPIEVETEEPAG